MEERRCSVALVVEGASPRRHGAAPWLWSRRWHPNGGDFPAVLSPGRGRPTWDLVGAHRGDE